MTDNFALWVIVFGILALLVLQRLSSGNYEEREHLTSGHYRAGVDIPVGKADLKATGGAGNFVVKNSKAKDWTIGNNIGATSGFQPTQFRNLILNKHDILEINGSVKVVLVPPTPILDTDNEVLVPGTYRFGIDLPPGKYSLEVAGGVGDVLLVESGKDTYNFYQDMAQYDDFKADSYQNVICTSNHELWIRGSLQIKLKRCDGKIRAWINKNLWMRK